LIHSNMQYMSAHINTAIVSMRALPSSNPLYIKQWENITKSINYIKFTNIRKKSLKRGCLSILPVERGSFGQDHNVWEDGW